MIDRDFVEDVDNARSTVELFNHGKFMFYGAGAVSGVCLINMHDNDATVVGFAVPALALMVASARKYIQERRETEENLVRRHGSDEQKVKVEALSTQEKRQTRVHSALMWGAMVLSGSTAALSVASQMDASYSLGSAVGVLSASWLAAHRQRKAIAATVAQRAAVVDSLLVHAPAPRPMEEQVAESSIKAQAALRSLGLR